MLFADRAGRCWAQTSLTVALYRLVSSLKASPRQAGQRRVARHVQRIQLNVLPATARSYSPVELPNHDVRANGAGRRCPRSASELRDEHGYLRRRQRQSEVQVRFFERPETRYAATS